MDAWDSVVSLALNRAENTQEQLRHSFKVKVRQKRTLSLCVCSLLMLCREEFCLFAVVNENLFSWDILT